MPIYVFLSSTEVDYTPKRIQEAAALEKRFFDFLHIADAFARNASAADSLMNTQHQPRRELKWSTAERQLSQK